MSSDAPTPPTTTTTTTTSSVVDKSIGLYTWESDTCDGCGGKRRRRRRSLEQQCQNSNDDDHNSKLQQLQPLLICQRCKCFAYHDVVCQRMHWKNGHHKSECTELYHGLQPLQQLLQTIPPQHHDQNDKQVNNSYYWWWMYNRTSSNSNSNRSRNRSITIQDRNDIDRIWNANVTKWNVQQDYVSAMNVFQQALFVVSNAWNNYHNDHQNQSLKVDGDEIHDDHLDSSDVEFAIRLSQRLLFCAYCESDSNQMDTSRIHLVQCISILTHLRRYLITSDATADSFNNDMERSFQQLQLQQKGQQYLESIRTTMNDAYMELMLSYDEVPSLRRLTRHVAYLAIDLNKTCSNRDRSGDTTGDDDPSWSCGWIDPLQRPGYMASDLTGSAGDSSRNIDGESSNHATNNNKDNLSFLSRDRHPKWCKVLEDHWEEMLEELLNLTNSHSSKTSKQSQSLQQPQSQSQWTVVGSGDRGSGTDDHRVVSGGGKWTEHVLFGTGSQSSDHDAPVTKRLLRQHVPDAVSLAQAGGGEIIFSKLAPHTHIEAHCGPTNLRWTCHLGLMVPTDDDHRDDNSDGDITTSTTSPSGHHQDQRSGGIGSGKCQIRVGTKWYSWKPGKVILFDDSWEHEVLNDTDEERIVLLLRYWHPSLTKYDQRDYHLQRACQQKDAAVNKRYQPPC